MAEVIYDKSKTSSQSTVKLDTGETVSAENVCVVAGGTGGGGGTWGSITGTLSDQADLQAALDSKATTQQVEEKSTVYIVEW